jgi:hypothetical protein
MLPHSLIYADMVHAAYASEYNVAVVHSIAGRILLNMIDAQSSQFYSFGASGIDQNAIPGFGHITGNSAIINSNASNINHLSFR